MDLIDQYGNVVLIYDQEEKRVVDAVQIAINRLELDTMVEQTKIQKEFVVYAGTVKSVAFVTEKSIGYIVCKIKQERHPEIYEERVEVKNGEFE